MRLVSIAAASPPAVVDTGRASGLIYPAIGCAVIIACLQFGTVIQHRLGLPVPGNVIGMVLLLVMLQIKLVPDDWIRLPCSGLLLLLPALFVPIYVVALCNPLLWHDHTTILVPAALLGVAATLLAAGWIAMRMRVQ